MTPPEAFLAWASGIDCALVTALLISLICRSWKRLNWARITNLTAQVLLLIQCAATIDWDLAHDNRLAYAQFPFGMSLLLSIPALFLVSYSVLRLLSSRTWPYPEPPPVPRTDDDSN